MTLPLRRDLLKLLPSAGLATLVGCDGSDESRIQRYEAAIESAKHTLQNGEDAAWKKAEDKKKAEAAEKAAVEASKKLVLYCAANLADPFQRVQADLMTAAVRTLEGCRVEVLDAKDDVGLQLDQLAQAKRLKPSWLSVSARRGQAFRRHPGVDERHLVPDHRPGPAAGSKRLRQHYFH